MATKKKPVRNPAAKPSAANKPAAKQSAANKPAVKPAAKQSAANKPAVKPATRKSAANKPAVKKPAAKTAVKKSAANNQKPAATKSAALPKRLLENLLWSFSPQHYASAAEFAAAVTQYNLEIAGENRWDPDAIAFAIPAVDLGFMAVVGDAYDDASTSITAEGTSFTNSELLWRIHEALTAFELADKKFFEGLSLAQTSEQRGGKPPYYFVSQGS